MTETEHAMENIFSDDIKTDELNHFKQEPRARQSQAFSQIEAETVLKKQDSKSS